MALGGKDSEKSEYCGIEKGMQWGAELMQWLSQRDTTKTLNPIP
jgi:hypothetical protein